MRTRSYRVVVGGRVYALTPQQKEQKKDYLLQQSLRSQPGWDEIWEEIKSKEYEWDRYIKQEAERLHPRYEEYALTKSLAVPHVPIIITDEMIEEEMQQDDPQLLQMVEDERAQGNDEKAEKIHNSLWSHAKHRLYSQEYDQVKQELEDLKGEAEENVKAEVYAEFRKMKEYLRRLDGKDCWRAVMVSKELTPTDIPQLGVYWAVDYDSAQPYYANRSGIWDEGKVLLVFRGRIDPDYIDWKGTAGARFVEVHGDNETEVRFFKHSPLYVHDVQVFSSPENWSRLRVPNEVIPIEDYRRC